MEILKATIFYIFHSCSCAEINIGYNICYEDNSMLLLILYGVKYSSFVLSNLLFSILHPALCPLPCISLDLTNDKYWKEQKRERAFFLSFLGHRLLVIALLLFEVTVPDKWLSPIVTAFLWIVITSPSFAFSDL